MTQHLHQTSDAAVWAEEFCKTFPDANVDEGCMIGWFANAMMSKMDNTSDEAKLATMKTSVIARELLRRWNPANVTQALYPNSVPFVKALKILESNDA